MNSLKIYSLDNFEVLFRPIIEILNEFEWITLCNPFDYPSHWLDIGYSQELDSFISGPIFELNQDAPKIENGLSYYGHHLKKGILSKYSAAISEDWSSLFAVNKHISDPLSWLNSYYEAPNRSKYLLNNNLEAAILNVDGSFWQVYLRSEDHVNILLQHLKKLPDNPKIEVINFEQFIL